MHGSEGMQSPTGLLGLPPPQQQQMLSLRATNQASLLSANPMLQRALLLQQMQGNLRGFNMTAPALQQFFPQATRHSLLGPPPVGVSLKPARLGFPGLPFQRQNRMFRKDFQRIPDRKQELDQGSSSQTQGGDEKLEIQEDAQAGSEQNNCPTEPETPPESSLNTEPAAKKLKSVEEPSVLEDAASSQEAEEPSMESQEDGPDTVKEYMAEDVSKERNFSEEPKAPEIKMHPALGLVPRPEQVLTSGGSLKVTIQQSSESRAISTTALKPGHRTCDLGTTDTGPEPVLKFYCYICKTNCCNQQNFQSHMAGIQHQQRLGEIQHMSNICFVSLLPMVKEQKSLVEKSGGPRQRWCNTCQIHFTGDLIKHRRTQEHKLAKRSLRPFCTVCSRHFKTPRKFVEHMKSPEHKQKAKEVRLGEKELGGPEDSEELITVDAVGCFEDDDEEEEEEEGGGEEEDSEVVLTENEDPIAKQRYKAARLCATAAHSEASLHAQLLDDQKQPLATKTEGAKSVNAHPGAGDKVSGLLALKKQSSWSLETKSELGTSVRRGESLASETDDIYGTLVIEEEGSREEGNQTPSSSEDCLILDEDGTTGELLEHPACKEESRTKTRQWEGVDKALASGSSEQIEVANKGQEEEAASLTLAGRRRSTRRKLR
uniref:CDKN1A interacting zinc finger protein 1 n=1 Tax=Crocodylus porosus TaxID=8502 RepID=A0A7M4DWK9_CROPO